ncbi:MAG: class I SAM-dependent methyltransferase family protein [Candidatus Bathyarchaeota archaeon]|nr:class I SAM-dependent methyltransferase family protein [Candidatus Bathyarchaeota archaeon]
MRKRLRRTLAEVLSKDLSKVYNSFDIVGDIAIIKLPPNATENEAQIIAKTIMGIHKNVKTILRQTSPVAGDFRLRRLIHVAGENKTSTIHREFGCLFMVDLAKCYFSPRLSHERMRIATLVEPNEAVVNMFAGVGCFSIIIAKHSKATKVFSIDVNAAAVQLMQENVRLNRVYDKVIPLLGDAQEIIKSRLQQVADRVLMPLPEKALTYLPYAISALKASGGWIHYYDFEHATKTENPAEKTRRKIVSTLDSLGINFEVPFVRVVRSTGPNWFQLAADIHIT